MTLLLWVGVFIISLIALVKGADWVLERAAKIGLALGLAPFVVGVVIIGFGTSAPEFVSSLFGVLGGQSEIPAANAVGSNIANILLIVGFSALFARGVYGVNRDLSQLELPMLALSTLLFFGVAFDGVITVVESVVLLLGFGVYLWYALFFQEETTSDLPEKTPVKVFDVVMLLVGLALLIGGAKFLIDAVIAISDIVGIAVGVITLLAVAVGTSLPELVVSIKASLSGNADVSLGNIFGSNVFNILFVVGAPGLLGTMVLDTATQNLALPMLLITSFLFLVSTLSRRVYPYEGAFYLLIYAFFVAKLFGVA